jgi:hypothetical protein
MFPIKDGILMVKETEYTEGPEARENFERLATAIFKAPKADGRKMPKKPSKPVTDRKTKNE